MEPVNKKQTYQTEDFSKTNAASANLLGCPGCDSRACVQANCWRVFCPPFPRCRACLESGEDLAFPQPCFFNPQFLHPFFHNGSVPQNYYCSHGGFNTNPNLESNIKDQVECGKSRGMATPQMFCQKMKKKTTLRDKFNEKNDVPENESKHLPQCQNQAREQPQKSRQPCDCTEPLLWPSNSIIIPIMSYCVLWHPQNSNENCSNYPCNQRENLSQKGEDVEGDIFSNSESNEKYDRNVDVENECAQDCSEDGMSKKETDREHNRSSSSFLSLRSSTNNGNEIYNIKKKNSSPSSPSSPSVNAESDANSEEEGEGLRARSSGSSSNSQNHLSVKSNENVLSNAVDYSDIYSAGNESQRSSTAGSEYDVKAEDSPAEAEEVDDQTECLEEYTEERNIHISRKGSLESLEEKNSEVYNAANTEFCGNNMKTKPKMLIKNFTVTNRTESAFEGTPKILAAGGDLGGNNCVGYKVNIEFEETELENSSSDTGNQTFEIKRIPIKVLEEKKPGSPLDKGIDLKAPRSSRTGIARLIQDSKSRDANVDIIRNIKSENKEFDCNDTKRRRFHTREEDSKFQKVKPGMAVQRNNGSERQNPTSNIKNRLPSKEKKFSAPKIRPHNCERNSRK